MDMLIWLTLTIIAWIGLFAYSLKFPFAASLLDPKTKKSIESLWLNYGVLLGVFYFFVGYVSNEFVWTVLSLIIICVWGFEKILRS